MLRQILHFKNLGILICLSTGMRIGELCALTWKDVDVNNGIISVNKTLQRVYIIEGKSVIQNYCLIHLKQKTL